MLWTGRWIIALVGLLLGVLLHKEFLKRVHKGDLPDAVVLLAINGACCVGICAWWWLVHPIAEWTLDGRERLIWLCLGVAFGLPLVGFILYCLWMILHDLPNGRAPQVVLQVLAIVFSLAFLAWWFAPALIGKPV